MKYKIPIALLGIFIPQVFEHISGNLTWTGFIGPNDIVNITAVIKATETGDFRIDALAGPPGGKLDGGSLYITVSENTGSASESPPVCSGNIFQVIECMRVGTVRTS